MALALLVGYFVLKIIDSSTKLQQREIGLSFGRIREELVEGSRDYYCVINYFESLLVILFKQFQYEKLLNKHTHTIT